MIGDADLERAVAHGILTADQAERLRALARAGAADAGPDATAAADTAVDPDDERFRLIGGFNDVFVTIGVGLLIAALFGLASVIDFRPGFAVLAMAAAWGLSEYFSRHMRLALPSIVLAAMFAGGAAFAAAPLGGMVWPKLSLVFAGLGAALAAVAHERRFRVPIDTAIVAAGLIGATAALISELAPDWTSRNASVMTLLFGLAVFAAAVRVDASDPKRLTRRSDIAFWLHLLAAPMIVHAVMARLGGQSNGLEAVEAVAVLIVFALLGLVAIVIDRRALLVSGLSYAGIAIAYLLSEGVDRGMGLSLTLLCLAILVLGLSAGWRSIRRTLLPLLPLGAMRTSIPPAP